MKTPKDTSKDGIASAVGHAVVGHLVWVGFSLLALPFLYLGKVKEIRGMTELGMVIFVIGTFVAKVTTKDILRRLDEDPSLEFKHAMAHTLYSHLCFYPLFRL
jgi:hypothetical protein